MISPELTQGDILHKNKFIVQNKLNAVGSTCTSCVDVKCISL